MNQTEQLEFIGAMNEQALAIIKSKGHDYANEEDVLQNFKQLHAMLTILKVDMTRIEGVHFFYILLKTQRAANLIFSSKEAKNESIIDTVFDWRNYVDLLNCTLHEQRR